MKTFVIISVVTCVTLLPTPIVRKTPRLPVELKKLKAYASYHLGLLKGEYPTAKRYSIAIEYIAPNGDDMRLSKSIEGIEFIHSKPWTETVI